MRRTGEALLAFAIAGCGGSSDTPAVVTQPVPVAASVIVTGSATVEAGKTIQLVAQARDASGITVAGKTFTWSSSGETIASVSTSGAVTGRAVGTANITASVDGKIGSLSIAVTPATAAASVSSVVVTGTTKLQAGATTTLSASIKDSAGNVIQLTPTWSSSDSTMISVFSDGTVAALRIGEATITASAGGKSGSLTLTSSLTPYTFVFTAGSSAADQQLIKDAVQYGSAFMTLSAGATVFMSTTIIGATSAAECDSGVGNAAFTGPGIVKFCLANMEWTSAGPIMRQKIVVHELFHIWQYQSESRGGNTGIPSPEWIREGSAELVAFMAIDSRGVLSITTARGCAAKEVSDFAKQVPPGLPPLSQVESRPAFQATVGPIYASSMLAVDQLVGGRGLMALRNYTTLSGTDWQFALQAVFGTSSAAFYSQFPAYQAGLAVPATYLCRV